MPSHKRKKIKAQTSKNKTKQASEKQLPWFVRFFVVLAKAINFIIYHIWRLSRKNIPLACGIALFIIVFGLVSYNALSQQSSVKRPVLFSTRSAETIPLYHKAQKQHPYVEKAITTKAMDNQGGSKVRNNNMEKTQQNDPIGRFLTNETVKPNLKADETKIIKQDKIKQLLIIPTEKPR